MEEYDAMQYPEGVEKSAKELLFFLPEDEAVRMGFMDVILEFLVEW